MRVLVDTGVLYSLSDARDQYHQRAREEAVQLEKARAELLISYPTLLESYSLVLMRLGGPMAQRWLVEALKGLSTINASTDDYQ